MEFTYYQNRAISSRAFKTWRESMSDEEDAAFKQYQLLKRQLEQLKLIQSDALGKFMVVNLDHLHDTSENMRTYFGLLG